MTISTALAALGFLITLGTILYHAGRTEGKFRAVQDTLKKQGDGLGAKCRGIDEKMERRQKRLNAFLVEQSIGDEKKNQQVAAFIKEDS